MRGASRLIPLPSFLALLPAGAHFWRSGQPGLAAACLALALLAWGRAAWVRLLLLLVLPLLAARWVWAAAQFVQMRMFMGEAWHRLAVILLSVALLTALGRPAPAARIRATTLPQGGHERAHPTGRPVPLPCPVAASLAYEAATAGH